MNSKISVLRSRHAFMLGCVAVISMAPLAAGEAQESAAIPDLSTNATSWDLDNPFEGTNSAFLKIPGDAGPGPVLQHPDFPYDGETTRRMADTSNPILQPVVKEAIDIILLNNHYLAITHGNNIGRTSLTRKHRQLTSWFN